MNLLVKGLNFLFPMSEEQQVDIVEDVEDVEEVEEVEEEKEDVEQVEDDKDEPAPVPTPPAAKAKPKKRIVAEPSDDGDDKANELDPLDLSDNKAAKRIAYAGKATFEIIKLDNRTRRLQVTLPKSKKPKQYPFTDFEEELIPAMKVLVEQRPKLKDQMSLMDCANHTPRLFWNAIYHWKTTDVLEQKLQEAGLTNMGRRTRRRVDAK